MSENRSSDSSEKPYLETFVGGGRVQIRINWDKVPKERYKGAETDVEIAQIQASIEEELAEAWTRARGEIFGMENGEPTPVDRWAILREMDGQKGYGAETKEKGEG